MKLDHSLPREVTEGFRTARWNLHLLAAQSQTLDSQAAPLQAEEEIHVLYEALIASEGRLDP